MSAPTPTPIIIRKKKEQPKLTSYFKSEPVTPTVTIDGNVCVELPYHSILPVTDKEHVNWLRANNNNKESGNTKWVITEQVNGKDVFVYYNGKDMVQISTRYHGFIDMDCNPFGNMEAMCENLWMLYSKLANGKEMDHIVLHLVLYGPDIDPASVFTNEHTRMSLVDVYLRNVNEEAKTEEDKYHYTTVQYSFLERLLNKKGAFKNKEGKTVDHLIFECPRIISTVLDLDTALAYDIKDIASELEKGTKVDRLIVKSDFDFQIKVKNQKRGTFYYKRMIFKIIKPATELYPNFSTQNYIDRIKGTNKKQEEEAPAPAPTEQAPVAEIAV